MTEYMLISAVAVLVGIAIGYFIPRSKKGENAIGSLIVFEDEDGELYSYIDTNKADLLNHESITLTLRKRSL